MTNERLNWETANRLIEEATEECSSSELCASPRVSVCVVTYNQSKYIERALDSVLKQQTAFPIELVVGDDCSSDRTTELVLNTQREHPDRVRVLLARSNLGRHTGNGRLNFIRTLRACRGNYIALLEGDDYWTDTSKLSRQVELMDSRPDAALCFHPARYVDAEERDLGRQHPDSSAAELSINDLVTENPIQTCSILLRRGFLPQLPEFFLDLRLGDWPLCLLAARRGCLLYIDRPMAAYRVHAGGVWSGRSEFDNRCAVVEMFLQLLVEHPELDHQSRCAIDHQIRQLRRQYEDVTNSWSYRLGRTVLWPARKCYDILFRRKACRNSASCSQGSEPTQPSTSELRSEAPA